VALKVVKADSEETAGEDGKAANAVDGDTATIWHTQWQDANPEHPHEIIIELSRPCRIGGFTYLPRQDDSDHGNIKDYEFYISDDGKDFGQPVKKGTFENNKDKKTVTFDAKQCRFIKLKALSEVNDLAWASAAEIGIIETASTSTPSAGDYIKVEIKGTLETGLMAIGGETTGTVSRRQTKPIPAATIFSASKSALSKTRNFPTWTRPTLNRTSAALPTFGKRIVSAGNTKAKIKISTMLTGNFSATAKTWKIRSC
jgi:hypothetical protein